MSEAIDAGQDQGGDSRPRAGRRPPEKRGAHQPRQRQRGPREELQLDGNVTQPATRPEAVTTAVSDSVIAPLAAAAIDGAALSSEPTQPALAQEAAPEAVSHAEAATAPNLAEAPPAQEVEAPADNVAEEPAQFTMPEQVTSLMAEAEQVEAAVQSPIGEEVSMHDAPPASDITPAEAEPAAPLMSSPVTTAVEAPAPEAPRERRRAPNDPRNRM